MTSQELKHATLVFERTCATPVERVFAPLADPVERANWGTPSETAALIYDETDFRVGGRDIFRCGAKRDPQYRGMATYSDIVPNQRIVSSETVETARKKLIISMSTTTLEPQGASTKVTVTTQLISLVGDDMINGVEVGQNASLR
jgi:uncharacterized protein YndB with AHSA1/START domain